LKRPLTPLSCPSTPRMQPPSPDAYAAFDCLHLLATVPPRLGGLTRNELHQFSFLGCLIDMYGGGITNEWGYSYVASRSGTPFSGALDETVDGLLLRGLITQSVNILNISRTGAVARDSLVSLQQNRKRAVALRAAATVVSALSLGSIRQAMLRSGPDLAAAVDLGVTRRLLGPLALDDLAGQFAAVRDAAGPTVDAAIPIAAWLSFLAGLAPDRDGGLDVGQD